VPESEQALIGQSASDDLFGRAGALAQAACSPIDDVRAPAAYRREMARVYALRALHRAWHACDQAMTL
jgi:carbon-monoxide dehydrogenase medium subunit